MSSALTVLPYTRDYAEGLNVSVDNAESILRNISYIDLHHSKYFKRNGFNELFYTMEEKNRYGPSLNLLKECLNVVFQNYDKIVSDARDVNNTSECFLRKIKCQEALQLWDNAALTFLKEIKVIIRAHYSFDFKHIKTILRMRNELITEKLLAKQVDVVRLLREYAQLSFECGSSADIFLTNEKTRRKTHCVMEKNVLFTINLALELHRMQMFDRYKSRVLSNNTNLKMTGANYHIGRFLEIIKDLHTERAVFSIISFGEINGQVTDLFISKNREMFGYGMHRDGTLVLRPAVAFGNGIYERASVFDLFNQLTFFPLVSHLKALCHLMIGESISSFYHNLIFLFPSLRHIEIEESTTEPGKTITDVISVLLAENSNLLDNIKSLSLIGYGKLSSAILEKLKKMKLQTLGLYGLTTEFECEYIVYLLKEECELRASVQHFKGNPVIARIVGAILGKQQLKNVTIISGNQSIIPCSYTIPSDLCNTNGEIVLGKIGYPLKIETITLVYRHEHYLATYVTGHQYLRRFVPELSHYPSQHDLIFTLFNTDKLLINSDLAGNFIRNSGAVKSIEFDMSARNFISEASLRNAFNLVDVQNGIIAFKLTVDSNVQVALNILKLSLVNFCKERQNLIGPNLKIIVDIHTIERKLHYCIPATKFLEFEMQNGVWNDEMPCLSVEEKEERHEGLINNIINYVDND
ncbi:hypothetical protein ENBRE01_1348 [Enteropsectra breve]|nr:hypothetical protein ENBRE01_1348 [Enteropsectra breve]